MASVELARRLRRASRFASILIEVLRVRDWWVFKLPPPLALFWATALHLGTPLLSTSVDAVFLLVAIAVCAAFVSLINDIFDQEEDARAGKPNRIGALPPGASLPLLAAIAAAGLLICWRWRHDLHLVAAYAASWLVFLAYSAPPLRLKTRGIAGVVADASGSTLFPNLTAILLATQISGRAPDPVWFAAVVAWALGWGVRGILWHQLHDLDADRAAGAGTFAVRAGAPAAKKLCAWLAFPLEMMSLALLIAKAGSIVPVLLLLLYSWVMVMRTSQWGTRGRPLPLDEFYDGLMPLAFLLASAAIHRTDLWLVLPLAALFGRRTKRIARDGWMLLLALGKRSLPSTSRLLKRFI